jgi:hypothetical protein
MIDSGRKRHDITKGNSEMMTSRHKHSPKLDWIDEVEGKCEQSTNARKAEANRPTNSFYGRWKLRGEIIESGSPRRRGNITMFERPSAECIHEIDMH